MTLDKHKIDGVPQITFAEVGNENRLIIPTAQQTLMCFILCQSLTLKPDFAAMTRKELRAYLLAHRNDEEAFFAYVV